MKKSDLPVDSWLRNRLKTDKSAEVSNVGNGQVGASDIVDPKNNERPADRKTLMIVFISLVLDLLAFTIILPLLPSILDYYEKHDAEGSLYHSLRHYVSRFGSMIGAPETSRWNSVLFGGMLGSLFSLLQFLTSPLAGAMSDVYGRRAVLILTSIGISISYGTWALSSSFSMFVLARVIGGVSKANISVSTAVVSDVTPQAKHRTHGMTWIGIAFSLGFLIGPMIGAYFSMRARLLSPAEADEAWPFYVIPALLALTLSIINLLFLTITMKETLPRHQRASTLHGGFRKALPLIHPIKLFKFSAVSSVSQSDVSSMQKIGLIYFLFLFLYSGLEFTLTFLTHTRFNYTSIQQGKMFFIIGIVMMVVQGGFVRRIKPGSEISAATKAVLILIPSFLLVGFATNQMMLYAGLILYSCASAAVVPCLTTKASSYGGVDQKGTVIGIFRSLGALARSLGPMTCCALYWRLGPECCYVIGALGLIIPLVMLQRFRRTAAA